METISIRASALKEHQDRLICIGCGRKPFHNLIPRWLCQTCENHDREERTALKKRAGLRADLPMQVDLDKGEVIDPRWTGYYGEILTISIGEQRPEFPFAAYYPWIVKYHDDSVYRIVLRWRAFRLGQKGYMDLTWNQSCREEVITLQGFNQRERSRASKFLNLVRERMRRGPEPGFGTFRDAIDCENILVATLMIMMKQRATDRERIRRRELATYLTQKKTLGGKCTDDTVKGWLKYYDLKFPDLRRQALAQLTEGSASSA